MQNPIKLAHQHISNYRAERARTIALDRELESALIDPGLIDRILGDRPASPQIFEEPVVPKTRPLSLDGILRAV